MMRTFALNVVLILLLVVPALSYANFVVIYVDQNATGANDGSSWEDAFLDLQDALEAALEGDSIWVAQGVYLPGDTATATFLIAKDIVLLGGFSGMETSADERDPEAFPTTLSGDINGDDLPEDLLSMREDNVWTVLTVAEGVTDAAFISGFIIRGGHSDGDDSAFPHRRGGGLFTFGNPMILDCVFRENYADAGGGGAYLQGPGANGSWIINCRFENNRSEDGAGLMVAFNQENGVTIVYCSFVENHATRRGGGIRALNANIQLGDCQFSNNYAMQDGGALEITQTVSNLSAGMYDCQFEQNTAYIGGGLRYRNSSGLGTGFNQLHIEGCTFYQNQAVITDPEDDSPRSGALEVLISANTSFGSVTLLDCQLVENSSEKGVGAARFDISGPDMEVALRNCAFLGNQAGTLQNVYLRAGTVGSGNVEIDSCLFSGNLAPDGRAGLTIEGTDIADIHFLIRDCRFAENETLGSGGGLTIRCWDDASVDLQLEDCTFWENAAAETGGAVLVENNNGHLNSLFLHCLFVDNVSPIGAVLSKSPELNGGDPQGSLLVFDNCLLANNFGDEALISLDSAGETKVRNTTIAENQAGSFFLSGQSSLTLQNSILYNPGYTEYQAASAEATILSKGGNLVGDNSLDGLLTANDKSGLLPLFTGTTPYPFQLQAGSPAIDLGVEITDTPAYDLAGNDRIQGNAIDAGAFESPFTSGSTQIRHLAPAFTLFPNPAIGQISIQWEDCPSGIWKMEIWNAAGQLIQSRESLNDPDFDWTIDPRHWPNGVYFLRVYFQNDWQGSAFLKTSP